ncbi:MAG: hypothetical protein QOJ29_5019, partial [Thermoleophilaceae bacterium]|nr:hypothetical protein [Thermoleophilaceae bacterium]
QIRCSACPSSHHEDDAHALRSLCLNGRELERVSGEVERAFAASRHG